MSRAVGSHYLYPGDVFVDRRPHVLGTVLGSCVAVCLWDRTLRFGGMIHGVLPNRPPGHPPSPRYVDDAVGQLVDAMLAHGCRPADLQAKVFGGANVLPAQAGPLLVGHRNIAAALEELARNRIPVVGKKVGGQVGYLVKMHTGNGEVWLRHTTGPAPPFALPVTR